MTSFGDYLSVGDKITPADPWFKMVIIKWTISIARSEFNHEQNRSIVLNFNTLYENDHDSTVNSTWVQLNHALLTILESKTVLQKIIIEITMVSSD